MKWGPAAGRSGGAAAQGCARAGHRGPAGGDEFVLVLQNLAAEATDAAAQVRTVCEQVLTQLRQPYLLDGHEHHVTASIGATFAVPARRHGG